MNKYSLANLFIALFLTVVIVFINGLCGGGGTMSGVVTCSVVSVILVAAAEVAMRISGKSRSTFLTYLVEFLVCVSVSFLALLVV